MGEERRAEVETAPGSRRKALVGLNLAIFSWAVGLGAAVPVIPILSYQLAPSAALAGVVTAAGGLGRLVISYFSGYLMDKYGTRRVTLAGIFIRMVFSFMEGLSRSYYQLVIYRFMSGVGTAIWGTGQSVIAADLSTRRDRGAISGGRTALGQLGNVLGPFLGAAVWGATGNIRLPFFINGFSKMACLLAVFFLVPDTERQAQRRGEGGPSTGRSTRRGGGTREGHASGFRLSGAVLTMGFFFVVYAVFVSGLFREAITNTLLPLYAKLELGLSRERLGLIISSIALGGVVVAFPAGYVVDRWGVKTALLPGVLLSAAALLLLGLSSSAGVPLALAFALGVGTGVIGVCSRAYAIDISPLGARGRFFGLTEVAAHVATLLGPLLLGAAADALGFRFPLILLGAMFAALLPLSLLSVRERPLAADQPNEPPRDPGAPSSTQQS